MPDNLRLIKPQQDRPSWGFVSTGTALDIARSIDLVSAEHGTLTTIAGVPGCGKSEALKNYAGENAQTTELFSIVAGEGSIWDLDQIIMERYGIGAPNSRRMREDRLRIMEAVGPCKVLVFDEAQYLAKYNPRGGFNFDAFEWLRAMAEEAEFSVVFCGDLSLTETLSAVPQLRRRIVRPVVVRQVPEADVVAVARARGVTDGVVIDALVALARRHGGLSDVDRLLWHARDFDQGALNGRAVKAAMAYLGLDRKGLGQ